MDNTRLSAAPPERWGAMPAILITGVSLCSLAGFALGFIAPLFEDKEVTGVEVTAPVDVERVLSSASTPAADAILKVLGDDVVWGRTPPVPFGCNSPDGFLTGYASVKGVDVTLVAFQAGYSGPAMAELARCGYPVQNLVDSIDGVQLRTGSGHSVVWNRGDLLVFVSGDRGDTRPVIEAIDERAKEALGGVCHAVSVEAKDATRNPNNAKYTQYRQNVTISIEPTGVQAPDPQTSLPQLDDLSVSLDMPQGVSGPALPQEVAPPKQPQWPGEEPVARSFTADIYDTYGPGCGWGFTATPEPVEDEAAILARFEKTERKNRDKLQAEQDRWLVKAEKYNKAAKKYTKAAKEYNEYVSLAVAVVDQWDAQRAELDRYESELLAYDNARQAVKDFKANVKEAQKRYDEDTQACLVWTEELAQYNERYDQWQEEYDAAVELGVETIDLPVEPEPLEDGPTCPANKPSILTQDAPQVPAKPTKPELWKGDDE